MKKLFLVDAYALIFKDIMNAHGSFTISNI